MSATIINLIIQLVSGAVGGNAVAAGAKKFSLGPLGNTIAGAIGGVGVGQLLPMLLGGAMAGGSAGGFDIGALITQVVGGGVGGAVLTAVVAMIKQAMAGQKTT